MELQIQDDGCRRFFTWFLFNAVQQGFHPTKFYAFVKGVTYQLMLCPICRNLPVLGMQVSFERGEGRLMLPAAARGVGGYLALRSCCGSGGQDFKHLGAWDG